MTYTQRTITHRGRTIREITAYKWTVDGWHGHSGYVTADAAIRAIDRIDRIDRVVVAR